MSKIKSEFLDNFDGQTRTTYNAALNNFIGFINNIEVKRGVSTQETKDKFDRLANEYLNDKSRNHYEDFRNFIADMVENERPPTTIRTYKNALNEFFVQFDITFTDKEKKNIGRKMPNGKRPVSIEETLTRPMLSRILNNLPVHGKAFALISSSSGMRIGEILQLKMLDMDIDQISTPIHIKGSIAKNGEPRITFISQEARLMVIEWLNLRETYISQASERNYGNSIDKNDNRLFPFTKSVVYDMWNSALRKSGLFKLDAITNRATIRIHSLRKYFRSNLPLGGCPVDVIEEMMGHAGYLTDSYRRLTESQLSELYNEHEHLLYIGAKIDDTSQRAIIEKQQNEIRNLQDTITNIQLLNRNDIENRVENIVIEKQQANELIIAERELFGNQISELTDRMKKQEEMINRIFGTI